MLNTSIMVDVFVKYMCVCAWGGACVAVPPCYRDG